MLFIEGRFFFFFGLVFGVHWLLRKNLHRKLWLTAASYTFYALWDWRFLFLILASTAIDYFAGRGIYRARSPGLRKAWLMVSLTGNLGLLGFYKYFDFFVTSAADLLRWFGMPASDWTLNLILPIGISFYTFQTLSYSLDIWFRRLEPVDSPLDLALFVGFFPQLVMGPIVRARAFLPQLEQKNLWRDVQVRTSITLFVLGFVKKACISDNLAGAVDQVFANPAAYGSADTWLSIFCFHVRIYCDFSGYSDMAMGLAGLLGYSLPKNFDFPYLTTSLMTFLRRWHITLGSWLGDYIYRPLGGNRIGPRRTLVNVFVVMTISGLWHGAAWPVILWGVLHGAFMVLERAGFAERLERRPWILQWLWAQSLVVLFWPFLRAPDMATLLAYLRGFLPLGLPAPTAHLDPRSWWLVLGFFAVHFAMAGGWIQSWLERRSDWAWALGLGVFLALMLPWVAADATPFIYFQF
jgi:alginate O-acetyltransferase complex protein AlgI